MWCCENCLTPYPTKTKHAAKWMEAIDWATENELF